MGGNCRSDYAFVHRDHAHRQNDIRMSNPGGMWDVRYIYCMVQSPLPIRIKVGISTRPDLRKEQVATPCWVLAKFKVWGAEHFERMIHWLLSPFHAPVNGNGGSEYFWSIAVFIAIPAMWMVAFVQQFWWIGGLIFLIYIVKQ